MSKCVYYRALFVFNQKKLLPPRYINKKKHSKRVTKKHIFDIDTISKNITLPTMTKKSNFSVTLLNHNLIHFVCSDVKNDLPFVFLGWKSFE